jgi:hypothetical protein
MVSGLGRMATRASTGRAGGQAALAIGGAAVLVFLALAFRPVVEGDGTNYFAYLHTLVIDHDLDFRDEYAAALAAHIPTNAELVGTPTATGLLANFQPVGSALLALPLFLASIAVSRGGEPPFAAPFVTAFTAASLLYGLLGLALSCRLAAGATTTAAAAVGTVVAVLTTPYLFYLVYEPSYAHTFSAFAVSAFVLAWWRWQGRQGPAGWFLLGMLGGLLGLVRIQDGPIALIALIDLPRARWRALAFLPGLLVGFAPQILVSHALFGTWLPYRPPAYALQLWPGHYADVLFSSHNGLLTWHPVFAVAALGLVLLRERRLALAALVAILIEVVIDGAAPDWWGGHSFGARRFLDLLPFLVVGLAELVRRLRPAVGLPAAAVLTSWNLALMANFIYVIQRDVDPGYAGLVTGQLRALRFLPRLAVQGGVIRDLLLWPLLRQPFAPTRGLTLLALEAGCLGALWAALTLGSRRPGSSPPR